VSTHPATAGSPFGAHLRRWRQHRDLSQLALATAVASTPRHISFLETGRSRPSRQMVLRLSDALRVPLRHRNDLLRAAGLPAAYRQHDLHGGDLAPYRAAIDRMLRAHLPYPALVVDAHWTVLLANAACDGLFGEAIVGTNMVRRYFTDPAGSAEVIVNWPQVAWAAALRLRDQLARTPFDDELRALADLAERAVADLPRPDASGPELVICPWLRVGDEVIRTIGMVARFDTTTDITLDELRIELTYPQDRTAEAFFRHVATHA
jgi:transcriptional regulator with XRE-family HTH domain